MAELPAAIPLDQVGAAGLPAVAISPTDLDFGQAAGEAQRYADLNRNNARLQIRAQAQAASQAVQPHVQALTQQITDQFASDAGKWTGQPGLAADQIAKATAARDTMAAGLSITDPQRSEFMRQSDEAIAKFGSGVLEHERAGIMQAGQDAADVQTAGALTQGIIGYHAAKQPLVDAYDGSQPGLTQQALSAFDAAMGPAIAAAPAPMQPRLQAQVARMRVEEAANLSQTEAHTQDAYALTQGQGQAFSAINSVRQNPTAYDDVVSTALPTLAATLPARVAGQKTPLLQEWKAQAKTAQVLGLIDKGEYDVAGAALADGQSLLAPAKYDELAARISAERVNNTPHTLDQAVAQYGAKQRLDANLAALQTTGRSIYASDTDEAADTLAVGLGEGSKYTVGKVAALNAFSAGGGVKSMTLDQLRTTATSAPPTAEPGQSLDPLVLQSWQIQHEAAAARLKALTEDPLSQLGAPDPTRATRGRGAAGAGAGMDAGKVIADAWGRFTSAADPQARSLAGSQYAGAALMAQAQAGLPTTSMQIVSKAQAQALAAGVVNAPPEGRMQALQGLAATAGGLPAAMRLPDGSVVSPRALLARQLEAEGLKTSEVSAALDLGGNAAALGHYVAAYNDPTLAKPLEGAPKKQLDAAVTGALKPWLDAVAPQPGQQAYAQARIDRTTLIARSLMAHGVSQGDAVKQAAADLTGDTVMDQGLAIPRSAIPQVAPFTFPARDPNTPVAGALDGVGMLHYGRNVMMNTLVADGGKHLAPLAAAGGDLPTQQAAAARAVRAAARWVTTPDGSGVTLTIPRGTTGAFDQVRDAWGRPVTATWAQLSDIAAGRAKPPFATPPAQDAHLTAASRQSAFDALSWGVEHIESGGVSGLRSPAGALGVMQLMPDAVKDNAPRLGLPVDLERARTDDAYNRAIGRQIIATLVNRYGATPGGLALATLAYHQGVGNVEGFTDPRGVRHPGLIQQLGDPRTAGAPVSAWLTAAAGAAPQGAAYVRNVLGAASHRLQGGG